MITYVSGNLFESPAQTLVNTVNVVGVMGKGIALGFKRIFPEMFREYQALCERGQLAIGTLHIYRTPTKLVLNFPTKEHWRNPSRLEYVEAGLRTFVRTYREAGIQSAAFPPLGCGNGELSFDVVRPLMEQYLAPLTIPIYLYAPLPPGVRPEHRDIEAIAAWLREEPRDLSFSEVWADLLDLLDRGSAFVSAAGTPFLATREADGRAVRFRVGERSTDVDVDDLLGLWIELREHGMLTADRLPPAFAGIEDEVLGWLGELPYIEPLRVAEDFDALLRDPVPGVRVVATREAVPEQGELLLV